MSISLPDFTSVDAPDDEALTPEWLPDAPANEPDENPVTSDYSCSVCGIPLEYSGRGRPPVKCDEHKKKTASIKTGAGTTSQKNEQLAKQAATALASINDVLAMALSLPTPMQMPKTASAIAARNEAFHTSAYEALRTDPALAASIVRAGAASGKVALIMAYGIFAAGLFPVIREEINDKRTARAAND